MTNIVHLAGLAPSDYREQPNKHARQPALHKANQGP